MSIRSRKRRRQKRGGYLGHLLRVWNRLPKRPEPTTAAERFGVAAAASGVVYAHPETAERVRDALALEGLLVVGNPRLERGTLIAIDPPKTPPPLLYIPPLVFGDL